MRTRFAIWPFLIAMGLVTAGCGVRDKHPSGHGTARVATPASTEKDGGNETGPAAPQQAANIEPMLPASDLKFWQERLAFAEARNRVLAEKISAVQARVDGLESRDEYEPPVPVQMPAVFAAPAPAADGQAAAGYALPGAPSPAQATIEALMPVLTGE